MGNKHFLTPWGEDNGDCFGHTKGAGKSVNDGRITHCANPKSWVEGRHLEIGLTWGNAI